MRISCLRWMAVIGVVLGASRWAIADTILTQAPDNAGSYLSQYDTNFGYQMSQVYDRITLSQQAQVDHVGWVGTYGALPPTAIDSFTISFWVGLSGSGTNTNGSVIASETVPSSTTSTANETLIGTDGNGNNLYSYSVDISSVDLFASTYWVSIVANINTNYDGDFNPINQWYWATSNQGDLTSYQDLLGSYRIPLATDFALTLSHNGPGPGFITPEPATWSMFAMGAVAFGCLRVRRRK